MEYEIHGENGFADVTVTLREHEQIQAEPGAMVSHSPGIRMTTDTGGGGLLDSARRAVLGGESVFTNTFTAERPGSVTLAPPAPGDVVGRFLDGDTLYADAGAYLASEPNVTVSTDFRGASKFFTGGDAFLLELTGTGTVFLDAYGAMERVKLDSGEQRTVDSDHVVAFDSSVSYDTRRVSGLKSKAFGGEGKVTAFTGPGSVWIQNRDFERLAQRVAAETAGGGGGDGGIDLDVDGDDLI